MPPYFQPQSFHVVKTGESSVHLEYTVSSFDDQIRTTVTADSNTVTKWIKEIDRPNLHIIGVGMQFRSFNEFVVATMELCVGGSCLIYQLDHAAGEYPDSLLEFLGNDDYTMVGWKICHLLTHLNWDKGLDVPNDTAVDLRTLTEEWYPEARDPDYWVGVGLSKLAGKVLEKGLAPHIPKVMQPLAPRWDLSILREDQVGIACLRAFASFEIGRVLKAREYMLADRPFIYCDDNDDSSYYSNSE